MDDGRFLSHSDPGQLMNAFFLGSLQVIIPELTDHARHDLSVDPVEIISQCVVDQHTVFTSL
jgi:hypothetical protein